MTELERVDVFRVRVDPDPNAEPISLSVEWEWDQEGEQWIGAVPILGCVAAAATQKLASARLEMTIRKQIALLRAKGGFREWLEKATCPTLDR